MTSSVERSMNYAILAVFSFIALYPIVGLIMVSLHPPDQPVDGFAIPAHLHFANYERAWHTGQFGSYLRSSILVAVAVVCVSCTLSILAGYAFGTLRFRGSNVIFYVFLLGLIMPYEAVIIPLYFDLRAVNLLDTYWALILPQIGFGLPFGIFWMRAFFRSVPRSLIEAARIDGASTFTILYRILLPYGRPAVLTMIVLSFMWTWNEFLLPLVVLSTEELRTAPLGLAFFQGRFVVDETGIAAAAVIVAAPVMLVYVLLQRHFIRGMLSGAVKG